MNEWIPQNVSLMQLAVAGVVLYAGFSVFRKAAGLAKIAVTHIGPGILCSLGIIGGAGAIGMGAAGTPQPEPAKMEGRLPFSNDQLLQMAKNAKSAEDLQEQIAKSIGHGKEQPIVTEIAVAKPAVAAVIDHPKVKSMSLWAGIATIVVAFGAFLDAKGAFK